jgi:hypothetical protein
VTGPRDRRLAPDDTTARIAGHVAARVAAAHPGRTVDQLLADDLAGNELTTVLLHGLRQRALRRTFADVRDQSARIAMSHAAAIDARRMHAFDGALFAAAAGFDAVEMAPVNALGASACAGVDPNHVLTASRHVEIAADPTTGLALLASQRRQRGDQHRLRLCASQRVLRLQPLDNPAFSPHFRLAALVSAERSTRAGDDDGCERRLLGEQLAVWAALVAALPAAGFRVAGLRVVLSDTRVVRAALAGRGLDADALSRRAAAHRPGSTEQILDEVGADLPRAATEADAAAAALALPAPVQALVAATMREVTVPLRASWPAVDVGFDFARLQGLGYYQGPFIQLHLRRDDGLELAMGDGGALPWLGALCSDRRERMVSTGIGAELLIKLFDGPP